MKILLLNPHWYDSPIVASLRKLGVAVLACSDLRECELVLKLHASSVTLFVGHDEDGVRFNEMIKASRRFARIPVVLTTSKWTDRQCADHQATPMGANAYVRTPVDEHAFLSILDQIFSTELAHGRGFNVSDELSSIDAIQPIAAVAELEAVAPVLPIAPFSMAEPVETLPPIEAVVDAPSLSLSSPSSPASSSYDGPQIQVEDAASVYGAPSPDVAANGEFAISLDAPDSELSGVSAEPAPSEDGGTREFRIEDAGGGAPVASPVLATPIAAESPELAPEEPASSGDFTGITLQSPDTLGTFPTRDLSPSPDDEQPTRVVVAQIPSDPVSAPESTVVFASPAPTTSPTIAPSHSSAEDLDAEALSTMPYLGKSTQFASNPLGYREPMDDAVVPGGAANAPDVETLKKYLYLREQDVSALSAQLRQARERAKELEDQLRHEKAITSEFAHLAQEQDRRIADFEKEKAVALEAAQKELDDVRFEMKRRSEKIRVMELHVREATEATERLKERVRNDIRKIRSREKELENRLEIMKKDSEALLAAREHKIIELKRKLDLVEFNTDLLQDQLDQEKKTSAGLREKLAKAAQIVRVAGGILTPEEEALIATGGAATGETKVPAA